MKKLIVLFVLLLALPVLSVCEAEYKTFSTDHYYFSVPAEWSVENNEKNYFTFFSDGFNETRGARISFLETEHAEAHNFELTEFYKIMRNSILEGMNNPIYSSEFFDFDQSKAIVFSCKAEGLEVCNILFHKEDYSISAIGMSAALSSADLRTLMISAFETVRFGTPVKEYMPYDYVTAVRNPEFCEGNLIELKGTVAQVLGSRKNGYHIRLRFDGDYERMVYIMIDVEHVPSSNILEDDELLIRGMAKGEYTYETVRETKITLPLVVADEVIILNYQ